MIKTRPDIYKPVTEEMENSPYLSIVIKNNVQQEEAFWFGKVYFFRRHTLNLKGVKTFPKWSFKKLNVTCG